METSLRPFTEEFVNEFENNLNWIYNAKYSKANEVPLTIVSAVFFLSSFYSIDKKGLQRIMLESYNPDICINLLFESFIEDDI